MQDIDPVKAQEHLDSLDKKSGINTAPVEAKSKSKKKEKLSQPNELGWKNLPLENLPSKGQFYVDSFTLAIKSATVAEIRHWSTIDETDMLSIDDQLNYILERCTDIRIDDEPVSWKEILEIDRFFIIFKIQELTFPNGENQLPHRFECNCSEPKYSEKLTIESSMLRIFDFPTELTQFYSTEERAYSVKSEKMNAEFNLYMPTLGTMNKLREIIIELTARGAEIDKAFIKIVPYLIGNWESLNTETYSALSQDSLGWNIPKFTFISKFADEIQKSKRQLLKADCPKCGAKIDARIFLDSSFTVKDLFLISTGFSELV
jgi:hypothetical protein